MTLPTSQVIPKELQQKWQKGLEALDEKLGGTRERPIDSLLVMLEVPGALVVLCTAGIASLDPLLILYPTNDAHMRHELL